jgi:hypothetical protein
MGLRLELSMWVEDGRLARLMLVVYIAGQTVEEAH